MVQFSHATNKNSPASHNHHLQGRFLQRVKVPWKKKRTTRNEGCYVRCPLCAIQGDIPHDFHGEVTQVAREDERVDDSVLTWS